MCRFYRQDFLVLAAVSLSAVATVLWWEGRPAVVRTVRRVVSQSSERTLMMLASTALLIWVGIFLVYGFPVTGDGKVFYNQAKIALSGRLVSAETWSAHMPLYDYINAVPLAIWDSLLAIPLLFTLGFVFNGWCLGLLYRRAGLDPEEANWLSVIAMLNGASWLLGIGYQQDEILLVLYMLSAVLLLMRQRVFLAGVMLGVGLLASKLTFGLVIVAALAACRQRARLLAGVVVLAVPVFAAFLLAGFDPVKMLGSNLGAFSPPSLPTVLGAPWYAEIRAHIWVVHAITVAWCILVPIVIVRWTPDDFTTLRFAQILTILWLGYVLITPKSLSSYRLVILPFLPLVLCRSPLHTWRMRFLFGVYTTALGSQFAFYTHLTDTNQASYFALLREQSDDATCVAVMGLVTLLNLVVIGCEIAWIGVAARSLLTPENGGGQLSARHSAR
jgi:hypothetical protein